MSSKTKSVLAISLWQPWASLMMTDMKRNETRSWPNHHYGLMVICAAQRKGEDVFCPGWLDIPKELPFRTDCGVREIHGRDLPLGAALGIVELCGCVSTERANPSEVERLFGDYSPGRYAWKTRLIKVFETPIPVKGKQGLFHVEIPIELLP